MKPDWDKLGKEYEASSSVIIADVDCTVETDLCSEKGVNGYPTIKYYPVGEGKDGKDYSGGRGYDELKKFVEDTLEVKCDVKDPKGCTEKEVGFITKMQAKTPEEQQKQLERLEKMMADSMKADLKQWVAQRVNVLKQLVKKD
eukprot:NODE_663_length_809_cov_247.784257_g655_i0.p1 GENE.NODE_663_length_809_cov_247.784257_g655_i0~~NODE_663_length_809_cov_247.784257_g655_i0.p1  ORF type:complete len:143 (-),score=41.30 NODE_663_length_809_cov_247.784257_g655_i0:248-676(-)